MTRQQYISTRQFVKNVTVNIYYYVRIQKIFHFRGHASTFKKKNCDLI